MKHFCSGFDNGAKINMEKVQVELGVADELEEAAWIRIDVILDEIFKYLSVAELKELRLVNKSFCVTGAKHLARRTLIRLTGIADLRPVAEKVPVLASHCSLDAYYFENPGKLDSPKYYIPIDFYMEHVERAAFDSGLVMKRVSVVAGSDIWLLPSSHFSRLQQLQVVTFRPSEGLRILTEFPRLFPNLKTLELKYIQKDAQVGETGNWPSMAAVEDEKEPSVTHVQLENLAITVSADWDFVGSSMFHRFRKLKTLKILWCGDFPKSSEESEPIRFNQDGELYGRWLQDPAFHSGFPMLKDVTLRFDLTPGNLIGAQQVLNKMKLDKLSLELYGDDFEFSQFIMGLQFSCVAALTKVHWATAGTRFRGEEVVTAAVASLFDRGFLEKNEWNLTFQASGPHSGCYSITKTKSQLSIQFSLDAEHYNILPEVISKSPEIASLYNYCFSRFRSDCGYVSHQYESFNPMSNFHYQDCGSVFKCKAVFPNLDWPGGRDWQSFHQTGEIKCACLYGCRKANILLCECPGFLAEIDAVIPHEHMTFHRAIITDVFCYVEPVVLKKWSAVREEYVNHISKTKLYPVYPIRIHIYDTLK